LTVCPQAIKKRQSIAIRKSLFTAASICRRGMYFLRVRRNSLCPIPGQTGRVPEFSAFYCGRVSPASSVYYRGQGLNNHVDPHFRPRNVLDAPAGAAA